MLSPKSKVLGKLRPIQWLGTSCITESLWYTMTTERPALKKNVGWGTHAVAVAAVCDSVMRWTGMMV